MSLQIPRRQYGVFVLDGRSDRCEPTLALLKQGEFQPRYFSSAQELREQVLKTPPHVIFFHRSDEQNQVATLLKELREMLPETHFFVLASAAGLAATWREWGHLISDCLMTPPVHPRQMIQAVMRAAERDAYMYRAEELTEKLAAAEALVDQPISDSSANVIAHPAVVEEKEVTLQESINSLRHETAAFMSAVQKDVSTFSFQAPSDASERSDIGSLLGGIKSDGDFDFGATWMRLIQARQLDDLVQEILATLSEQVAQSPTLFLRHLPNRRLLLATAAHHLDKEAWKGLGLNLAMEPGFSLSDLRHPDKLAGLREMAQALTQKDEVWVKPLILREEVYGLFLVMGQLSHSVMQRLDAIMQVGNERGRLLDMQQYLHTIEIFDPSTLVLNRTTMESRLLGEIARARRLHSPVSLLSVSLDQYRDILSQHGLEEAQMAVRALVKIIQPRSRANDILGRLSAEELGLILPHTSCEGATIKAERLRKLIQAADFSRLLPRFPQLTVSIGVSEYPSCCRDVEDLFGTADDALWQVKNKVNNKVCVSTPVTGFVPDFQVSAGI